MTKDEVFEKLIQHVLTSGGEEGRGYWDKLDLSVFSQKTGLGLDLVYAFFPYKVDILKFLIERTDQKLLSGASDLLQEDALKDRLFELIMQRYDILTPYKPLIKELWQHKINYIIDLLLLVPSLLKSLAWTLQAAGIESRGIKGCLRMQGLLALSLGMMDIWLEDSSEDQGKTLAALNENLRRLEDLAGLINI